VVFYGSPEIQIRNQSDVLMLNVEVLIGINLKGRIKMIKGSVINYSKGKFYLAGGRIIEPRGKKEFNCLPTNQKMLVGKANLWKSCAGVYIPISQLDSCVNDIQFCSNVDKDDKVGFYNVEVDDEDNFLIGVVNEELFTDPQLMVNRMKEYDVVVAYNSIRFDNEILAKNCPYDFIDIENAGFVARQLKGVLCIDLLSILSNDITIENRSSEDVACSVGFDEDLIDENKIEEKCKQDVRMVKIVYEKKNIAMVFNTISKLVNLDSMFWQMIPSVRLRKFLHINKYLREGILPLKKTPAPIIDNPEAVKMAKKGYYQGYSYWDISSTYPQTAVNIGNLGVYGGSDSTFSKLQEELSTLAKNKIIKPYMKFFGNALVGSMRSPDEYFRNVDINTQIMETVREKVMSVIDGRDDVIFSNTDCWVVPADSGDIKIEGYEITKDYDFSDLFLYNVNRWCGRDKLTGKIKQKGFEKLTSKKPKILKIAREEIFEKLNKVTGKKFVEILDKPKTLVSKTMKSLKNYDDSFFKITVRKTSSECSALNLEWIEIWDKLKIGRNDLYYGKDGEIVFDVKEKDLGYYKLLVLGLAEEYDTKNIEEIKEDANNV